MTSLWHRQAGSREHLERHSRAARSAARKTTPVFDGDGRKYWCHLRPPGWQDAEQAQTAGARQTSTRTEPAERTLPGRSVLAVPGRLRSCPGCKKEPLRLLQSPRRLRGLVRGRWACIGLSNAHHLPLVRLGAARAPSSHPGPRRRRGRDVRQSHRRMRQRKRAGGKDLPSTQEQHISHARRTWNAWRAVGPKGETAELRF